MRDERVVIRAGGRDVAQGMDRRNVLKLGAAGVGLAMVSAATGCSRSTTSEVGSFTSPDLGGAPANLLAAQPIENVRIGFVGVGGMGSAHVRNLLRIDGCRITAVCDIVPEKVERIQQILDIAIWNEYTHIFAGYGFMAEDAEFIQAIEKAGLTFIAINDDTSKAVEACENYLIRYYGKVRMDVEKYMLVGSADACADGINRIFAGGLQTLIIGLAISDLAQLDAFVEKVLPQVEG